MKRWSFAAVVVAASVVAGTRMADSWLRGEPSAAPAVAAPRELSSYRDVVKKVLPAVVSIESRAKARRPAPIGRRAPRGDSQVPDELRRFFDGPFGDEDSPSQPAVGFGSGFIVDAKGVILTNFHVVDGAEQVEVTLRDGRKFKSKEVKTDPKTDLAIVRIDAKAPLPSLELGDSASMEIGDRVLAVGAPFGLAGSVTSGIISAKGRSLRLNMYEDFLQTDAAINPGNSGGPLVNLEGKVIGINSAIKSRSGGFQGVGMAIASNLARNIMEQLLKDGVVHRGYLGVQISDVNSDDLAKKLGLKEAKGVLVTQVFENAPAAKAGLQEGDVIVGLAGKPVNDSHQLQSNVASLPLGKPVELKVVRDSKPVTLSVTVEEQPRQFGTARAPTPRRPAPEPAATNLDKVGLEVTDLTEELAERLGYKLSAKGVLITQVDPDGVAASAGLRRGMLITKIDKQPVTSAVALKDKLAAAALDKGVLLQVQSPTGGSNFVLLKVSDGE